MDKIIWDNFFENFLRKARSDLAVIMITITR